ncbi:hypothetical protein FGG08_005194 [Glutinoglossum americanum]|uniref:Extradiol ring-cleavage dioxygenase class III enzyme subunit B domain-containing protein n=1 Tax=Glutinoglossum americanum TaxID=1670608 RepID=A0A9P8I9Z4_9PEZI|nr:hypothetical protein FGG08_005194 [Glutinoglossum americanum]
MYDVDHPAYKKLQQIGKEITAKVRPKAVVVVSAHWQARKNKVQINTSGMAELIYEYEIQLSQSLELGLTDVVLESFYGFPSHYYKERYPNVGSREVAEKTISLLRGAGIEVEGVERGLDHGVWASFKCAFEPNENPLNVPIVQLSLFNSDDPDQHYRLGQALSKLRSENIQIVVSGMAVHNLRDSRFSLSRSEPMPYAISFDEALHSAAIAPPAERQGKLAGLLKREDAREAHPSFEHLLPIHVGAGAAGNDVGTRIFTLVEGGLSWAQYRFGNVPSS